MSQEPDRDLVNRLRRSVATAELFGLPLPDLASTITIFTHAEGRAAGAQIGDGAGVLRDRRGWHPAGAPHRGQYANQTSLLIQKDAVSRINTNDEITGIDRVMLCSDGRVNLTLRQPEHVPHEPHYDGAFRWLEQFSSQRKASHQLIQLLLSDRVRKLTDDDLSMFQATLLPRATPLHTNVKSQPPITAQRPPMPRDATTWLHRYRLPNGQAVNIGQQIALGGEGSVHEVAQNPDIVDSPNAPAEPRAFHDGNITLAK